MGVTPVSANDADGYSVCCGHTVVLPGHTTRRHECRDVGDKDTATADGLQVILSDGDPAQAPEPDPPERWWRERGEREQARVQAELDRRAGA